MSNCPICKPINAAQEVAPEMLKILKQLTVYHFSPETEKYLGELNKRIANVVAIAEGKPNIPATNYRWKD